MSGRFHIIDDAFVILRAKGVYEQVKVFRRGRDLYAGNGATFVKLLGSGGTSVPTVSYENLDTAGVDVKPGRFGAPELVA